MNNFPDMPAAAPRSPLANIRRFVRQAVKERCELCAKELGPEHPHLLNLDSRHLACACDACAMLFSTPDLRRFRRVPRRIQYLPQFAMTDVQWDSLHIPIQLAFFYTHEASKRVIAMYPGPAGATESLLPLEAWQELAAENSVLGKLEPDVEALLVNRVGPTRDYYRVPIDECYKLVGLIRTHWRGLSGGTEVWREINAFFASQKARSSGGPHA